jgi:hypothetical protein
LRRILQLWPSLVILACLFLFAASKFALAPRTIRMRWDYDYKNDPPCASRWNENCTRGFYVFLAGTGGRSQQLFVDNRFDKEHRVVGQGLEATFPVRQFGYLQFCVVAVKQGAMATTAESVPLCSRRVVLPVRLSRRHRRYP